MLTLWSNPFQFCLYSLKLLTIYYKNRSMIKLGDIVEFNIGGTPSRKIDEYWNG